jgi:benzoyl-CoA reductase/2-hydroxyglutaryl-CoA dehydratase subunit BcrC/BadD/HgdB
MRIVYRSPFIPAEWIAAHGLAPCRLVPTGTQRVQHAIPETEGLCPFVRCFLEETFEGDDALVMTTFCDQVRRGAEQVAIERNGPVFLLHLPTTWQTASAQNMYRQELLRLSRFLQKLGGHPPGKDCLGRTMLAYEDGRRRLAALAPTLTASGALHARAMFFATNDVPPPPPGTAAPTHGVPLALLGGPLCLKDCDLLKMVEEAGGDIVLDGTETGERTLPPAFDRRTVRDDPFAALCDAYFGQIPDAFRRPNALLYQWLDRMLHERGAKGVLLVRYVWCDNWHAEVHRIRDWLDVPLLDIDLTAEPPGNRTKTRVQAFVESLS